MKGSSMSYKQATEEGHSLHLKAREVILKEIRLRPERQVGGNQGKMSGNSI